MNQFWDQLGTGLGDILINTQQPFGTLGGPPLTPEQRSPVIQQGLLSLGANILADNTRNPFQALGQGYNATRAQGAANQLGGLRANMDQTALNQNLFELSNAQKRKRAQEEFAKTLPPSERAKFEADPENYMAQSLQAQFAPDAGNAVYGNVYFGPDGTPYQLAKDGSGLKKAAVEGGGAISSPWQTEGNKVLSKSGAQVQFDMPAIETNVSTELGYVSALKQHPALNKALGADVATVYNKGGMPAVKALYGGDVVDVLQRINQIKGGAFLQAYQLLKGGGAIANAEGEKAQAAKARLEVASDPVSFAQALDDYATSVKKGFDALKKQAGGGGDAAPAAPSENDPLGLRQ